MKVLAQSATVWKIVLNPNYVKDDETRTLIANGLAEILDMEPDDIMKALQKKTFYYRIKSKVETDVKNEVLKFKNDNELGNAIILEEDFKRYYPYNSLASTVLGFTNSENQGVIGVEASYNDYLSGVSGKLVTARNAR